jgi:uncharacterized protein
MTSVQASCALTQPVGEVYIGREFAMHVGVCRLRFRLPENSSLKGKRHVVKSITGRVANRFNVSIAEIEDMDLWQVATLGLACVSNDKRHANEILSKVVDFISESFLDIEMLDYSTEIVPVFDMQDGG